MELIAQEILTLKQCAKIVIRFECTVCPDSEDSPRLCPYANMQGHLQTLHSIRANLLRYVPNALIDDFLFFQTAFRSSPDQMPKIIASIESFTRLGTLIASEWLEAPAIPKELYEEWALQSIVALETIECYHVEEFAFSKGRSSEYPRKMALLSRLFQFVVYPLGLAPPASPFMPVRCEEETLFFKPEEEGPIDRLLPLLEDVPFGPGWKCAWIFKSDKRQWVFSVTIQNAMENPFRSFVFEVPLDIPPSEASQDSFFILLGTFVDAWGKEIIDGKSLARMGYAGYDQPYFVPPELLRMQGTADEIFDGLLSCSPSFVQFWEIHKPASDDEAKAFKRAIYQFITTYRLYFKIAVYAVLWPKWYHSIDPQLVKQAGELRVDYRTRFVDDGSADEKIFALDSQEQGGGSLFPADASLIYRKEEASFEVASRDKSRSHTSLDNSIMVFFWDPVNTLNLAAHPLKIARK